jgi:polysaccharide biosynthesis/export protein
LTILRRKKIVTIFFRFLFFMKVRLTHYIFASILLSICLPVRSATAPESARRLELARIDSSRGGGTRGDYVLQPLDLLRVQVFQEDDINKQGEVRISEQATITLPLIGTVSLRAKTVRQAESMIRELYDKDYLVNPQVNVQVLKYAERFVNVNGAVNTAGRVAFPQERGLTIVSAITAAGGQSRIANLTRVKLTRKGPDGVAETREINVDAIMKGGGADDVPLENDDTIFVPERIL